MRLEGNKKCDGAKKFHTFHDHTFECVVVEGVLPFHDHNSLPVVVEGYVHLPRPHILMCGRGRCTFHDHK